MAPRKSTRVEKPVRKKKPEPQQWGVGPKTLLMVAAGVMAGGILIAARQQTPAPLVTTPRQELVPMPEARVHDGGAPAAVAGLSASAAPAVSKATAITVSGCLVRTDDVFRLKDTAGAEAPKARSWKTGFLKKGSASFEVVDAMHALNMASHVGQRVSVTGTLIDGDMQARSMRRVSGSCAR